MRDLRLAVVLAILAAVPASPVAAAEKPKPRVVLVEANGPDEEVSAFVARLESELSDAGKVTFSDARLSGAAIGSLGSEPEGEAARAFRAEWPGGTWLAVSLSICRVEVNRMSYSEMTPQGYTVQRYVENVGVNCPTSIRLVDALTGKEGKPLEVTGTASYRRSEAEGEESSELEGTRDAARKVAKKLPSLLKK